MSQFHIYILGIDACLANCFNSVLNVNALVGDYNQEKSLVGALLMIVKTGGSVAALAQTIRAE